MAGKSKGKTENDLEAMSDDDRRAYLESEDEAGEETETEEESTEDDESDETETDEAEQGQETEQETETTDEEETTDVPGGNARGALKAKNAEIKRLKALLNEQGGKIDSLTTLVGTFMAQGMNAQQATQSASNVIEAQQEASTEDPEPDFEDDPVAWKDWFRRQQKAEVEAIKKEFNDYRQQTEGEKATTALQQYEQEFAEANPDYYQIVNLQDKENDLTKYYASHPAVYAEHMGSEDPVKAAYEFGVSRLIMQGLYQPSGAKSKTPKPPVTPAVVKGKQAPPSLAAVPSSRERIEEEVTGDLTEEQVAALTPKQREKYLRG